MTAHVTDRYDRPDANLVRRTSPQHVSVEAPMRGRLALERDGAQHRRYTACYDDLQN